MRRRWLVLAAVVLGLPVFGQAATGWMLRPAGPAAARGGAGCVLQSEREPVFDGYQETWAQIVVEAATVRVTSGSILDPGDRDIGLSVDGGPLVVADEVVEGRTAVFKTRYRPLVDDFRRGLRVRAQLRFWPTWPKTGTHDVTFGLIGFTRAHTGMGECKAP